MTRPSVLNFQTSVVCDGAVDCWTPRCSGPPWNMVVCARLNAEFAASPMSAANEDVFMELRQPQVAARYALFNHLLSERLSGRDGPALRTRQRCGDPSPVPSR